MYFFEEKISLVKTWVGALILSTMLLSAVTMGFTWNFIPSSDSSNIYILVIVAVEVVLFTMLLFANLNVHIDLTGIEFQWFPLMLKSKKINWDLVEFAWVRKCKPLKEYGGWGIRGTRNNRAFNVAGNWGLQLILSDKKRIFIETQNPEKVMDVLTSLASMGVRGMNQLPNE